MAWLHTLLRRLGYLFYRPKWLEAEGQARIERAVSKAEGGHRGELVVLIERSVPLFSGFAQSRQRAVEHFSTLRVWDTEANTGVLIYLCLSERSLEVVVDRGLDAVAPAEHWQMLCEEALEHFRAKDPLRGLEGLIERIGADFKAFDAGQPIQDPKGNELSNQPVVI